MFLLPLIRLHYVLSVLLFLFKNFPSFLVQSQLVFSHHFHFLLHPLVVFLLHFQYLFCLYPSLVDLEKHLSFNLFELTNAVID